MSAPGDSRIYTADEVLSMTFPPRVMLIDPILPAAGCVLIVSAPKTGKTVFCVQVCVHVAMSTALFGFPILAEAAGGATLIVECDDPAGKAALQPQLRASPILKPGAPLHIVDEMVAKISEDFIDDLRRQITARHLRVLVLDSYSQMRPDRAGRADIVKTEREEIGALDTLAKQTHCLILLIHHDSHGHASLDWSDRAAGSYSVGASVEGQVHISRFPNLPDDAPERLIRARLRGGAGFTGLLRFSEKTLDYELAFAGDAARYYEELTHIKQVFGLDAFKAAELEETGLSRASAYRLMNRLLRTKAVERLKRGEYRLAATIAQVIDCEEGGVMNETGPPVNPNASEDFFKEEAKGAKVQ